MKSKRKRELAAAAPREEAERIRFIERPDGVYWRERGVAREHGPFNSLEAALTDSTSPEDSSFEPGESLEEAEAEIGIAEWIDPDTGVPAEESVPRIEDH